MKSKLNANYTSVELVWVQRAKKEGVTSIETVGQMEKNMFVFSYTEEGFPDLLCT